MVGYTTKMQGYFFTELWGNSTIDIDTKGQLTLTSITKNSATATGVKITTKNDTNPEKAVTTLTLGGYYTGGFSTPFLLDMGESVGSIRVVFDTRLNENKGISYFRVGMSQHINGGGLKIEGHYAGDKDNNALWVGGNTHIKNSLGVNEIINIGNPRKIILDGTRGTINTESNIATKGGFYGDGTGITNTASGSGTGGENVSISGVGSSNTIYIPTVSLGDNKRPNFGSKTLSISMPTADDIWNAISEKLSQTYAAKTDLNDYIKKNNNYTIHSTDGSQTPFVTEVHKQDVVQSVNFESKNTTPTTITEIAVRTGYLSVYLN